MKTKLKCIGEIVTTYQALLKAMALSTASLSHSWSLRGSYMKVLAIIPIVPPCLAWISNNFNPLITIFYLEKEINRAFSLGSFFCYLKVITVQVNSHSMWQQSVVHGNERLSIRISHGTVSKRRWTMTRGVCSPYIGHFYKQIWLVDCGPVLHPVPKALKTDLGKMNKISPAQCYLSNWKILFTLYIQN